MKQRWEAEKAAIAGDPRDEVRARGAPGPDRAGRARGRLRDVPPSSSTARCGSSTSGSPSRRRRSPRSRVPGSSRRRSTADEIAEIVATWTGIPVSRLMEGELAKLVHMEERLHERVVGQDEAI